MSTILFNAQYSALSVLNIQKSWVLEPLIHSTPEDKEVGNIKCLNVVGAPDVFDREQWARGRVDLDEGF